MIDLAARAREALDYEQETGIFRRKVRLAQCHRVGDRADHEIKHGRMRGYRRVAFDGKRYLAHRLAWLYVFGRWPDQQIDHINGDRGDNRIGNLRDVPMTVNAQNVRRPRAHNSTGVLGAVAHQGRFRVRLSGKHIGCFDTPQQAHQAYLEAKRRLHEGCTL